MQTVHVQFVNKIFGEYFYSSVSVQSAGYPSLLLKMLAIFFLSDINNLNNSCI